MPPKLNPYRVWVSDSDDGMNLWSDLGIVNAPDGRRAVKIIHGISRDNLAINMDEVRLKLWEESRHYIAFPVALLAIRKGDGELS